MKEVLLITKALADGQRLRILKALERGELCVCQITGLLGLAPSTVSKHLSQLHGAGLITFRKDKRWVYYRVPGKEASAQVKSALKWVFASLEDNAQSKADLKKLKVILRSSPEELCRQ